MTNKLDYSFDDEPVSKFCYSLDSKKIEVYFTGHYDLRKEDSFIEAPCVFIIENWVKAKSRVGDEEQFYSLDKHMGIFSIILYMKYNEEGVRQISLL